MSKITRSQNGRLKQTPDIAFVHIINDGPTDVIVEVVAEHTSQEPKRIKPGGKAYHGLGPYRSLLISYPS